MKYWYDTEFIETGKSIDLLSLGIVSEDGRELYFQSERAAFYKKHPEQCSNPWVRESVIPHLDDSFMSIGDMRKSLIKFCDPGYGEPELWGYYSAYDHVALCWLFGAMIDLPKGWPMYTCDIKQWCDALGNPELPKQGKDGHNALADARWNKAAWEFLLQYEYERNRQRAE